MNRIVDTCHNCKFYEEVPDQQMYAGLCHYGFWFNGKKMRDVGKVDHTFCDLNGWCKSWEHFSIGLTHFEVTCRVPEARRTKQDVEYLSQFIEWRPRSEWWGWNEAHPNET